MVQVRPVTEDGTGSGYQYEDTRIIGFTHTNKGHWNLCNIPVLPLSGSSDAYPFSYSFSHKKEKETPAFYQVYLQDQQETVRLTSTLRCAIHEYTCEDATDRWTMFDLARANNRVQERQMYNAG